MNELSSKRQFFVFPVDLQIQESDGAPPYSTSQFDGKLVYSA